MTALNWVAGPLAVVLIVVLFGSLAFGGWGIAKVVRLGGADPTRRGPLGGRLKLPNFDLEFLRVAHSVPEAQAVAIRRHLVARVRRRAGNGGWLGTIVGLFVPSVNAIVQLHHEVVLAVERHAR